MRASFYLVNKNMKPAALKQWRKHSFCQDALCFHNKCYASCAISRYEMRNRIKRWYYNPAVDAILTVFNDRNITKASKHYLRFRNKYKVNLFGLGRIRLFFLKWSAVWLNKYCMKRVVMEERVQHAVWFTIASHSQCLQSVSVSSAAGAG